MFHFGAADVVMLLGDLIVTNQYICCENTVSKTLS